MGKKGLLIFNSDLRLHDNLAFSSACNNSETITPVYILDENLLKATKYGFPRIDRERLYFLFQCLQDLEESLSLAGSKLHIIKAPFDKAIDELVNLNKFSNIFMTAEDAFEEKNKQIKIIQNFPNASFHFFEDNNLIDFRKLGLDKNEFPNSFSKFRNLVEPQLDNIRFKIACIKYSVPKTEYLDSKYLVTAEQLLDDLDYSPDPRSAFPYNGGEIAGIARLHDYLEGSHQVRKYKKTRNGMVGASYSSKLAPWLASGSLSVRHCFEAIENYENQFSVNESTYWLKIEILWREFFRHLYKKHGVKFFTKAGMNEINLDSSDDIFKFRKWAEARTGDDFVDANMKELNSTGFMSNRGRQNVASYLIFNLGLNWQLGAQYFESKLIDYDVYVNYGNWQYIAGLGATQSKHEFDTVEQAKIYDPEKVFVSTWS